MTDGKEGGKQVPGLIFLIFGAIVPFLVVILELTTGMCATEVFDPIPTVWHTLLVAFVPVSNLSVWLAARGHVTRLRLLALFNGAAIGVSFYYTLLFLPLLPLALIALLWGIGLLPMAPLFSFVAASRGYFYLRGSMPEPKRRIVPAAAWGLVIVILLTIVIELPRTVTRVGMKMAVSQDKNTRLEAIKWLRLLGNRDLILEACYFHRGAVTDFLTLLANAGGPVTPHQAQEIYYRVTGVPYNAALPPDMQTAGLAMRGYFPRSFFDPGQGGKTVANKIAGLSLESSRFDGSVDASAGLAYLEWTLELKNESLRAQEARAQIALPAGGFVSRATLWVDGEEREAAFAARAEVRNAYERVVKRQRDPLLITTNGPDRILLQCFPVGPGGGVMKVRLGITAALVTADTETWALRLPHFSERNFIVRDQNRHHVWIESKNELSAKSASLMKDDSSAGLFTIRGELTDHELASNLTVLEAAKPAVFSNVWAEDEVAKGGQVLVQSTQEEPVVPPDRVIVVVDGSVSMRNFGKDVAAALHAIPEGISLDLLIAADSPPHMGMTERRGSAHVRSAASKQLAEFIFVGGCDNIPALSQAWDMALNRPNSAVVWIHGPQPIRMESTEMLRQKQDRRKGNVRFYCVEAALGRNVVIEDLEAMESLRIVPRLGELKPDLERLFGSWNAGVTEQALSRRFVDRGEVPETARKTSMHMVRLWAHDEVLRLARSGKAEDRRNAVKIAAAYNLVTPVSGAVVLESAQQYHEAGLTPAAANVPTIPEPETWLLMCVSAIILLWIARNRRRACTEA